MHKVVVFILLPILAGALIIPHALADEARGASKIHEEVAAQIRERGQADVIIVMARPSATQSAVAEFAFANPGEYVVRQAPPGAVEAVASAPTGTAAARISSQALEVIAADANVSFIAPNLADPPALAETVEIIGASGVWNVKEGKRLGAGYVIAILDTGIDPNHPFFKGKAIQQACFSRSVPEEGIESLCPDGQELANGEVVDLGRNAATGCPKDVDGCAHGTHVAGIAAGQRTTLDSGETISGIAPGASILAIQVFSRFNRKEDCFPGPAPCTRAFRSSQIRALDFVQSQELMRRVRGSESRILAVNMSLGGGRHVAPCDDESPLTRSIDQLRELGIATFIASGNSSYFDAVAHPGCITKAMTVGAVDKNGALASFSNRSDRGVVDFVTVGVGVHSSIPGGGFMALDGTSMATPAVAAAWTLLRGEEPDGSVDQLELHFKQTGRAVLDPFRGEETQSAIDLKAAFASPIPASTGDAEQASSASVQPGQLLTETRFVVRATQGEGGEAAASIEGAASILSSAIDSGEITVVPLPNDQLQLTTERPVTVESLKRALSEIAGDRVEAIFVDVSTDRPLHRK